MSPEELEADRLAKHRARLLARAKGEPDPIAVDLAAAAAAHREALAAMGLAGASAPSLEGAPTGSWRLGDKVATALAPLVKFSDKHLGTDLAHCRGCPGRQQWLNRF